MRAALGATAAVALVALTACSPDADAPSAEASQAAAVSWSPCDGLTAESVSQLVGQPVDEVNGIADQPRCTFAPTKKGGAAYDVNYLWFDGSLDAALDAMGAVGSQLKPIDVPGADAARLAVKARKDGVLVTGFVQTDGLVQSVNAVELAPYDRAQLVAGTKALLRELAAEAPESP
jgi:hypothetical protein